LASVERPIGGQQHGGSEIVGQSIGELGHEIGSRRCHDNQVGVAGEADVSDILLVLAIEDVGEDVVGRQRADRKRRHELPRGFSHHRTHGRAALLEPADQVERLIGRDAAGDDEQNALVGKGHRRPVCSGRLQCRLDIGMDEIITLEKQRQLAGLGQSVGKAVAEV